MTEADLDRLLAGKRSYEDEIARAFGTAGDEEIEGLVRRFLCCKYLLRPEELTTDDLFALGSKSTAKLAGLEKEGILLPEQDAGCTTAPSGLIKKVLLAMAIAKRMGVRLDPDQVAQADTIPQLARLLIQARKEMT